jgi:hypothetical protein
MFVGLLDSDPLVRRYGSGLGSFYHQTKLEIKTFILIVLDLFMTFYLLKMIRYGYGFGSFLHQA